MGDKTKIYCMPKLRQVRGHCRGPNKDLLHAQTSSVEGALWGRGAQNKDLLQGNVRWRCFLAALRTAKLGPIEVGNQAKPPSIPNQKVVCSTNLQQMFKRAPTDRRTQLTTTQQRLT